MRPKVNIANDDDNDNDNAGDDCKKLRWSFNQNLLRILLDISDKAICY